MDETQTEAIADELFATIAVLTAIRTEDEDKYSAVLMVTTHLGNAVRALGRYRVDNIELVPRLDGALRETIGALLHHVDWTPLAVKLLELRLFIGGRSETMPVGIAETALVCKEIVFP